MATFNEAFWMRLLRYLCLDDLRWCRWPQLITHTYKLTLKHVEEPDCFFNSQLVVLLGRVLRAVPLDKATFVHFIWHTGRHV